jgi:hypothetical protein
LGYAIETVAENFMTTSSNVSGEVVSLLDSETLNLAMTIFLSGKELPLGNAVFRRV